MKRRRAIQGLTALVMTAGGAAGLALAQEAAETPPAPPAAPTEEARIAFPADYRDGFTQYLSLDRVMNPDQIIRLFANDLAMQGRGPDGAYPEGSILVGEIYAARKDEAGEVVESALGQRIAVKLAAVAVMEKRAGWGEIYPEELNNGDWDFAIFSPAGERLVERDLDACRACHAPLDDEDYVFSWEHLPQRPQD